jgi:hypothetical protein
MSITIPAQTDELRIVGAPTVADAQLLVAMAQVNALNGADDGFQNLLAFETAPTLTQLRRRYPADGREYRCVINYLHGCEALGTFVKNGLLHEGLVRDLYWIEGAWRRAEKICKALRKEAGEPRLFENFELLAHRAIAKAT